MGQDQKHETGLKCDSGSSRRDSPQIYNKGSPHWWIENLKLLQTPPQVDRKKATR
ncbi:uncharacterized protein TrAtP1_002041 [Trichoderma atroviride]|uniref:uncharacterized protein n=1 Tax=Hypocrea atroviridis TaxID=63577 RepID=UPI00331FC9DD|nr:hypothetical protein TrAtP1_002041 [Trichoderma atroviride]